MPTLLFTSLAMCSTLAGGYVAVKARHRIHLLMGLGAGVLLGAVFFDVLPEALSVADLLTKGVATRGSNLLRSTSPHRRISGVSASVGKGWEPPGQVLRAKSR